MRILSQFGVFKIILSFFLTSFFYTSYSADNDIKPIAKQGVIDLRQWSLEQHGSIDLNGEWEFYWNKLLTPSEIPQHKPDGYINQPTSWNAKPINGREIPVYGVATYRLVVLLNSYKSDNNNSNWAFKLRQAHSASKVWINGVATIETGKVNTDSALFKAVIHPEECFFKVNSDTLEIVIQVANFFDNRLAGIDDRMYLATQDYMVQADHRKMFLFLSSFAILLFIGAYHILLWLVSRDKKVNLYFSMLSIIMAVLSVMVGDKYIYYLIPGFPLELYYRIWYSFLILIPLFFLYLKQMFPEDLNHTLVRGINIFYGAYLVMVLFFPKEIYIKATYFVMLVSLVLMMYYPYIILQAVRHKRRYSLWVMVGIVIGLVASINDLMFAIGWILTGYYTPVGFLACVVIQSVVLSVEFSRTYHENILLKNKLQVLNIELEEKILQRTKELDVANKELKETIAAKDKFFSILSHDLKNPFFAIKLILDQLLRSFPNIDPAKLERNLQLMSATIYESSKILENLNIWSHVQTGKIENNAENIDVKSVVERVIQLKELSAEQKEIVLSVDIKADSVVFADLNMFEMVLRNLISNAVKFTPRGGFINISSTAENKQVVITVSDTGVGISSENIKKLFKIDGGFHTNGTEQESGTGLGLMLCFDFIKKMNGTIHVNSELEKGSEFIVTLPAAH